ncbi:hypothetical protein N9P38_00875 [Flavobacteriales bacterium]|nr:hypothetical protein [Flavobacteriales bacterium]MDB4088917.1 hypothetical protein [Flavobacteriales bacterium]
MKLTKRIGLFAILFGIPLIFLYTLARGKNNSQDLPYFGKTEELAKQTEIKDFTFYDIDSNVVNKETTKGQTLIVSTLIPSCPEKCPIIQKQLKFLVYDKLFDRPAFEGLMFLSHLVDTNGGNPDLSYFVDQQVDYDLSRWKMVTGPDNPIYDIDLPNANLKNTDFKMSNTVGGETYYSMILLIDRDKKVRGLYQGNQTPQIEGLRKDIRKLFIEYKTIDKLKKAN